MAVWDSFQNTAGPNKNADSCLQRFLNKSMPGYKTDFSACKFVFSIWISQAFSGSWRIRERCSHLGFNKYTLLYILHWQILVMLHVCSLKQIWWPLAREHVHSLWKTFCLALNYRWKITLTLFPAHTGTPQHTSKLISVCIHRNGN